MAKPHYRAKTCPDPRLVLMAVAFLGVASLSRPAVVSDPEPPFGAETVRALTAIAETGRMASVTPGMVVGIRVPGKGNYVRSFGIGNLATGAPVGIEDHFRIASITKTFTATAVLQLIDQERLALDAALSRFVEAIPNGERIRSIPNFNKGNPWGLRIRCGYPL